MVFGQELIFKETGWENVSGKTTCLKMTIRKFIFRENVEGWGVGGGGGQLVLKQGGLSPGVPIR